MEPPGYGRKTVSEKKSLVEVLGVLVERVRIIERDAGKVAAVLDHMIEQAQKTAAPVSPLPPVLRPDRV
jgi:hypothetical protein